MLDGRALANNGRDDVRTVLSAFCEAHALPGSHLTVALSGGLDSVALLHASLSVFGKDCLSAVHVHHGLQLQADEWAMFCVDLCAMWQVDCRVEKVAVEHHSRDGLEGAARRARHAVFAKNQGDGVLLAHHRDDQAETLLFRLLRGTGVVGAAGMRAVNGKLLRPWLSVSRAQILAYAQTHRLRWIEDPSNRNLRFSRNYLRHAVMPCIEQRFPSAAQNLAAAASRFAETGLLLDDLACSDLAGDAACFPVAIARLKMLNDARARNLLRFLLQRAGIAIPSAERLNEAVRQLCGAAIDRHPRIRFGNALLFRRDKAIHLQTVADCPMGLP